MIYGPLKKIDILEASSLVFIVLEIVMGKIQPYFNLEFYEFPGDESQESYLGQEVILTIFNLVKSLSNDTAINDASKMEEMIQQSNPGLVEHDKFDDFLKNAMDFYRLEKEFSAVFSIISES